MKLTLKERLTGLVWWPRNRDPRIRGPQPRIITIEQARAMERHREEVEKPKEGEDEMDR